MLPSSSQRWAHATNTVGKLSAALEESSITAIEADILLGAVGDKVAPGRPLRPVLAHPPLRVSDLSLEAFLEMVKTALPIRHIKLDFKEMEVLGETLELIGKFVVRSERTKKDAAMSRTIFLNADILPGPGKREPGAVTVPAADFLETCLRFIESFPDDGLAGFAFSLGYKVDYTCEDCYSDSDRRAMSSLVDRYGVAGKAGIVLALNARILARNPGAFDAFLRAYSGSQILAWTGNGEPAIETSKLCLIKQHFVQAGLSEYVGFDCAVK